MLLFLMSKKGSYIGGHTLLTIKKKNKSKVTTGSIIKSKRRWPYKTIKPDDDFLDLTPDKKLIIQHLKTSLVINERRININLNKKKVNHDLLKKLGEEKKEIIKIIKITLGNLRGNANKKGFK